MTDLHTHILPGMDDGAKNADISLAMLRMEREQGIDTVVLTPHFYREDENAENFLRRRKQCYEALQEAIAASGETLPRLVLGAEVAFVPNLAQWDELEALCIGQTKNMLLELPFHPWSDGLIRQLYDLVGRTGICPVLAHFERYLSGQKPEHIRDVLDLGVPVQLGTETLFRTFARGKSLKMLRHGQAHFIASDCHNLTTRPPNLGAALAVVRKKLMPEDYENLLLQADELAGGLY